MERRRLLLGFLGVMAIATLIPWTFNLGTGFQSAPLFGAYFANSPQGVIPKGAAATTATDTGTPLQKFVNGLPGLGAANANNLGQYIPVANPDTTTFPGADYYVIGIAEHQEQMHSNLPGTGYGTGTHVRGYYQINTGTVGATDNTAHYLGPLIVAQSNKPVRVKFVNQLPASNMWLPEDSLLMGAGMRPDGSGLNFAQNRTVVHLHGGATPWISDGTPYQWFTPTGTAYNVNRGPSYHPVPDMYYDGAGNAFATPGPGRTNDPGPGAWTAFYTNQQSGRMMFYHEHAVGTTHYGVYAGLAAGYLLRDPVENAMVAGGTVNGVTYSAQVIPSYAYEIPLIIQDRTFVPKNVASLTSGGDPAWLPAILGFPVFTGQYGDFWMPHVYEPNQSVNSTTAGPSDGRWDYGQWVFGILPNVPPFQTLPGQADLSSSPEVYQQSTTPEAFMDTPIVNGTAYPFKVVEQRRYRMRILNACNDRSLNLQLYFAADGGGFNGLGGTGATASATASAGVITAVTPVAAGSGYTNPPGVFITGGGGYGAIVQASVVAGAVVGYQVINGGTGYAPTVANPIVVTVGHSSEVALKAAPGTSGINFGVIPDPAHVGPQFIQIANEGGFLATPAVWNDPANALGQNPSLNPIYVDYEMNRLVPTFGNVLHNNVLLGPAQRTDIIVDFSACPVGSKLIMYNDCPAPIPGVDQRYDYFTSTCDFTGTGAQVGANQTGATGGAAQVQPGFGPNTRTILQFQVVARTGAADPFTAATNLTALNTQLPAAFAATQPGPIVPKDVAHYGQTSNDTSTGYFNKWQDVNEQFDLWARMNATLAAQNFNFTGQVIGGRAVVGSLGAYADPPDNVLSNNAPQVWKFVHNGVDTHFIHFHLFNVQVINRVDQFGAVVSGPNPDENGWRDTVRMNPLEIVWVAMKPKLPTVPFAIPRSVRPLNPAMSWGAPGQGPAAVGFAAGFSTATQVNAMQNYANEYVFHCHLLGHEENDMMRPMVVNFNPPEGALELLLLE